MALSAIYSTCLAQPQTDLPPPQVELQLRSVDGIDLLGLFALVDWRDFVAVRNEHGNSIDMGPRKATIEQLREEIIVRSKLKRAESHGIDIFVNACRSAPTAVRKTTLERDDHISLYFNRIALRDFFTLISRELDLELAAPDGLPASDLALMIKDQPIRELLTIVDNALALDTRIEGRRIVVRKARKPLVCPADESPGWRPALPDAVTLRRSLDKFLQTISNLHHDPCKRMLDYPETHDDSCRYLEHFGLQELAFKGYIKLTPASPYAAIVETPAKSSFLQQIYVDDRLGEQFGVVTNINPSDIEIIERHGQTPHGRAETLTRISLQDGNARTIGAPPDAVSALPMVYREYLERYDLEDLWIRSTEQMKGRWQATVTDPFGVNHAVIVANHLGTNLGKITSISANEVSLEEIVPDAAGGYYERTTTILPGVRYEEPHKARLRKYAAPVNATTAQEEFIDAARWSTGPRLQQLAAQGAQIDAAYGDGRNNALVAAISARKPEAVTWLLAHGAQTNILVGDLPETPLHVAAALGMVEITRQLIAAGADVNFQDVHEHTPIVHALLENHYPIITLLVASGADLKSVDDLGLTPFIRAAYHGQITAVELFLEHGVTVFDRDRSGCTLLCAAVQGQHGGLVSSLIRQGSDVNAIDRFGTSVLDFAQTAKDADPEIIKLLVSHGARIAGAASDKDHSEQPAGNTKGE